MTFFYDLNKKLAGIADKPEAKPLTESTVAEKISPPIKTDPSERGKYKGKDIGDLKKMKAANLEKTSGYRERGEKVPQAAKEKTAELNFAIRAKQAHGGKWGKIKEESMEEGMVDTLKKAGKAIGKAIAGPSDQELLAQLQDKMYPGLDKVGKAATKPPAQPRPMAVPNKKSDDIEEGPEVFKLKADAARKAGEKEFTGPDGKTYPVKEAAKPDYIDLDKDGNRKESMKKAAADAKSKKHHKEEELDEGWDDMLKDVEKRHGQMKKGEKVQGHKGEIEKTDKGIKHTRRYDDKTGETDTGDDDTPKGEKRRGRPKGTGKAMGAKGPSGRSKLMTKEEIDEAIAALEEAGYHVQERKLSSSEKEEREDIVKGMKKNKAEFKKRYGDRGEEVMYATATKLAKERGPGNPDRKKKEKTQESGTVAGSVATSTEAPKGKGGISFGKGIYDSMNRELENMISESMNVSVNMSMDEHGEPHKSISVSAEGEAAEQLAQLLNLAGLHGHQEQSHACPACGQEPCGCAEMVDENAPDWPTNTEVGGEDDPTLSLYAGGLNKPKETGQTTAPVVNRDPARGSYGPMAVKNGVTETTDLGMKLYHELKQFKG